MNGELEDYRAYEKQLGEQLAGFTHLRHQIRFFPLFALVTGVAVAIATRVLFGLGVVAVWLIVWSASLYITSMRSWQYGGERARIQREIGELERRLERGGEGGKTGGTEGSVTPADGALPVAKTD